MKNIFLTIMLLAFAHGSASGQTGPAIVDRVVAVVNNDIITMSDLHHEAAKRTGSETDERLVLEDLIDKKLELAEAREEGLEPLDQEVAAAIADIRKRNNLDEAGFQAALARDGLTEAEYRSELRDQIMLSRIFNKQVRAGLTIEENELRAYYDRNQKLFSLPEEIRVRQIFLNIPATADPAAIAALRERAREALERARQGEDFVKLAREFSSDGGEQGGDLGFMRRDHLLPEIEQAARPLQPGQIAGPIESASGFRIIRLEEVRNPSIPFEKVKEEIRNNLYQQKLEYAYRTWLQSLRNNAHIENKL